MGPVAGLMFLVGSVITVAAILFPHSPKADISGFWCIAAATAMVAAVLLGWHERLPAWAYQGVMILGALIISLTLYFNGERHGGPAADNEVLYVWIALYSGYFFTRAQMAAQLAFICVAYAVTLLIVHPGEIGFTRWFITIGMVVLAGSLVHTMKRRNDQLVERLFEAVRTDLLTGLVNRQGFDERFEAELERARRTAQPVALVLADIDGFKELNDRFGHPAGDLALTAVGRLASSVVRTIDTMARIGGDEFAVILPATGTAGAFELAERLRDGVPHLRDGYGEPLTMSFGIVEFPLHGQTREALVRAADRALYQAKGLGRNCSVVHQAQLDDTPLRSAALS
jgi:diguanylate cyclase (GGDEF)-like protein